MAGNISRLDNTLPSDHGSIPPPRVPGIIEGSMTIHLEAGGGVSFRMVIGTGERNTGHDLLELIIDAEHMRDLGRVLATYGAGTAADSDPLPAFPCHIGFCRNTVSSKP